jgi:hypothetical protein
MGKPKSGSKINTPLKGQISHFYQRLFGLRDGDSKEY